MTNDLKKNKNLKIFIGLILLIFLGLLSISLGSLKYSLEEIFQSLTNKEMTSTRNIIVNIRLPRILMAILVGGNLAVSGALLQSVMQNPLADPGLTGVSSGASLAALLVLLLFPGQSRLLPLLSFIGGALACLLVYILAWKDGIKPVRIILAGVAINAILGGASSLLSILHSDKIQGVLMWINGSMAGKTWLDVRLLSGYSFLGLTLAFLLRRKCNTLQLGDDMAHNLGVDVNRYRIIISLVAVYLAGISVAFVGIIGFVGLIVPHIARLLVGSDYRQLLPMSLLMGASILVLADSFARTIASPIELPVGVIMSVVGGPFFLYLMRRGK